MASLALMTLAQTAPVAAPPPQEAREIVVIGKRLEEWRGHFAVHDDEPACTTTHSTGDEAVDAIGCEAMTACMGPMIPQVSAMLAREKSRKARQRAMQRVSEERLPCMIEHRKQGIARLARQRSTR